MNHPFRKKWGQNFLKDPNIINKIIECLEINHQDEILEIGPGDGSLTNELVKKGLHIYGVEIDPLLVKNLRRKKISNLSIYHSNILDWDLSILPKKFKIIGNLPFYISSQILFLLLNNTNWDRMTLMFQKEVAERIVATPGKKTYGILSIMSQVYTEVKINFFVSKNVFYPKPAVDAAIITFTPSKKKQPQIKLFKKFIKQAFSQRRKKLKNNLPDLYHAGLLNNFCDKRPEEISCNDFIKIFNLI